MASGTTAATARRTPGIQGVWVFVGADSAMFVVLFGSFMYYRAQAPDVFEASRPTLDRTLGGLDTLVLLTSSWCVALAVRSARNRDLRAVPRWLAGAAGCGVVFVVSKAVEYTQKLGAGLSGGVNEFYTYYYSLTGLHLAHVTAGMVVLAVMWWRARTGAYEGERIARLESGATYWHMVDYLWVVIFPLLYLMP